ncbi:cytochrome P450 monooxygenase-like protein [Lojkania enalia]|uniref:Cytochrome P450 monooxygenase-like protein n=1 Tax=Lojkania enalia TaxID=147567 RepID=A0A9P4N385_9PLEO|nr:cytochrome P450 monooxygenase-like protein [Didymosphaeria enalia]
MELESLQGFAHTFQTAAVASLIFAACIFFSQFNLRFQMAKLPSFIGTHGSSEKQRQAYLTSAKHMYVDGYNQFKDSVYRMVRSSPLALETVVIAPRFLPELRKLPDDVLNFPAAVKDLMEVKYTKLNPDEPIAYHTIKADLTPALARLNPILCEEVDSAVKQELGACKDWTSVPIYMALVKIVAKVSGRVFVGPDLCHDKDYLDAGINYTLELIGAQRAIKEMRPWLRPLLAPRLPEVRRLREREQQAQAFLKPIIKARLDAQKDPEYQKPDDMLQWFMSKGGDSFDSMRVAKFTLGLIFAAIHTTTMTATNILYTLAATPEYIEPLRQEIRTVMADNGGIITSRALQQMQKLDSYMKEVFRVYPPGFTSFNRKVLKGITLSNGQYLPPGVTIEIPSYAIYRDEQHYPSSSAFDGFRFSKLRASGTGADHARNQFVSTNETNLGFGYGRHACPGRFFAANEIKMILARLVLEYDIANVEGQVGRYDNIEMGKQSTPDPRKLLMFRKASV